MTTPDEVFARELSKQRQIVAARRRQCRMAESHRWWPIGGPTEVTDGPMLAVCLNCTDVRSLKAILG